jgi:hypothetical protein
VPARSCRVDQQRSKPLHPAIDTHVVDRDAAFGEQLFNVSVRQAVPQIPPKRHHDHVWRSGSREEFHLPAPTDPYVNLSVHTALVILVVQACWTEAVHFQCVNIWGYLSVIPRQHTRAFFVFRSRVYFLRIQPIK